MVCLSRKSKAQLNGSNYQAALTLNCQFWYITYAQWSANSDVFKSMLAIKFGVPASAISFTMVTASLKQCTIAVTIQGVDSTKFNQAALDQTAYSYKQLLNANLCAGINCGVNGTCSGGTCQCKTGFTGTRCEIAPTPVDPCATVNCGANGSCSNGACVCRNGYTGSNCQTPPDPCAGINCGANGTCSNGSCVCKNGFTGNVCQTAPAPAPAPAPVCELGCNRCGYNWYTTNQNNGYFNQYCNCCGGTQAQQDVCKKVCTAPPTTPSAPTVPGLSCSPSPNALRPITVGPGSSGTTKTVPVPPGTWCPPTCGPGCRLNTDYSSSPDNYSLSVNNGQLTVTRLDNTTPGFGNGWGMNLKVPCYATSPVTVGSQSGPISKTVSVPPGTCCPSKCGPGCRLNSDYSYAGDTFNLTTSGGNLTATRTDNTTAGGWGMNLVVPCIKP